MHYHGVGWIDKPNVSDGLWACWVFNPTYPLCHFFMHSTIGSVHHSSRGNLLAQKRACRVENARKVFNLAVLFALQPRFCAQNLTRG